MHSWNKSREKMIESSKIHDWYLIAVARSLAIRAKIYAIRLSIQVTCVCINDILYIIAWPINSIIHSIYELNPCVFLVLKTDGIKIRIEIFKRKRIWNLKKSGGGTIYTKMRLFYLPPSFTLWMVLYIFLYQSCWLLSCASCNTKIGSYSLRLTFMFDFFFCGFRVTQITL